MSVRREHYNAEDRFAVAVLRHEGVMANVKINACFFGLEVPKLLYVTNPNDPKL